MFGKSTERFGGVDPFTPALEVLKTRILDSCSCLPL